MIPGQGAATTELTMLFLSLIVGGETVLLPALQLNLGNEGFLRAVMLLAVLAAVVKDLFWYCVGRYGSSLSVGAGSLVRRVRSGTWVKPEHFEAHWKKLLVLSKFIYGTRTSAQLICGATKRRVAQYLAVNVLGTVLMVIYLHGLTVLLARGFSSFSYWPGVVSTVLATMACAFVIGRGARFVLHHRARL